MSVKEALRYWWLGLLRRVVAWLPGKRWKRPIEAEWVQSREVARVRRLAQVKRRLRQRVRQWSQGNAQARAAVLAGRESFLAFQATRTAGEQPLAPVFLRGLDLSSQDWHDVDWRGCVLIAINFRRCDLSAASFAGAWLSHCDFDDAIVHNVDWGRHAPTPEVLEVVIPPASSIPPPTEPPSFSPEPETPDDGFEVDGARVRFRLSRLPRQRYVPRLW